MANDLNLPTIADGQADSQWQTSNDGDAALGNALSDIYAVDFSAGNVTLTSAQYRSALIFKPSAALAAARTLILPAVKRPLEFHNPDTTYAVTLKKTDGGSPEVATSIVVAAGDIFVGYTDGTASGLFGTVIVAGAAPTGDVVGPGSAVDSNIALFNTTTGKLIKDSGVAISLDGTFASNSDAKIATEKAVKTYVDGLAVNLGKRGRVRVATTANITILTALNNGDTLDGLTLATGEWVLVKDQSSAAENGVYAVGVVPARVSDFDEYDEYPGSLIAVEEGTANADTLWLCTSNAGGTINVTAIAFSQLVIGSVSDGDKGDVTVSGSGTVWTVDILQGASAGDILYYDTNSPAGWQKLAHGSIGQFLKSLGAGAPAWADMPYDLPLSFPGTPTAGQLMGKLMVVRDIALSANFSGSFGHVGTNPAATFSIDVQDNGSSIGTISISTGGSFTFTTSSGTAKTVSAGHRLEFYAPANSPAEASIANIAATLKGAA